MLAGLQLGEFVYEQPAFPETAYIFKHALTQEVAYGSLLGERRKELHECTAGQIEALFNSRLEDHYGGWLTTTVAAPISLKALEYLQLAAQQAIETIRKHGSDKSPHCCVALVEYFAGDSASVISRSWHTDTIGPVLIATKGNAAPVGRSSLRASAPVGPTIRRER